ncbi:MAG: tetratricopeptide repeat protein [Microcoleus sp.]
MASQNKSRKFVSELSAEDSLKRAWEYHQAGRLSEAESLYRQIIEVQPESANVLCLLGIAARQQGKIAEAIAFYEQAIAHKPDLVEAHLNKAHVLLDIGENQRAIACYEQVIKLAPNSALAHNNLGWLKQQLGETDAAIFYYQTALQLDPSLLETYHNLANLFKAKGQFNEAIASYRNALQINPNLTNTLIALGTVLQQQGQLIAALNCYQQAVNLDPNNAEALNNVGALYHEQGHTQAAISHYQQALNLKPDFLDAINNLGHAFVDLGQFQSALSCHYRALELQPENSTAHLEFALTLLLFGDFRRGFAEYEWRWRTSQLQPRQFAQPVWDGSSLQGKTILLHVEQGLGDSIQFIRYAPILSSQGAKVIVACYPELMRLFGTVAGVEYLSVSFENLPAFDVHAPLMSLPYILGTTLETIPANIPYLAPPAECKFALSSDAKLKVGIVWAGNPKRRKDAQRSCNLSDLMQFLDVPGIAFYSLQKNLSDGDRTLLHQHLIPDLSPHLNDFADTASAISQLDLVISVDTAVAHLAGALGKPVWVLLSFAPDWRWLLDREDNPWYPTARLFRQTQPDAWEELFEEVKAALSLLVATNIEAQLQQAESLMEIGDREEAIALYEQIISLAPNCVQARINLGFLQQEKGELDAAIPHYREAWKIDPNIPQTAYNLAKVFEEKGQSKEAIEHYKQALVAQPDFVPALINLAVALQENGELLEAINLYRRALEVQPNSWEALNNLGTVLQEQGHLEDALEYYHKALELLPDFVEAINNLGRTFLEKGAVEDAIACYRRVISLSPEHASAHLNLSLALLLVGELENGFAEYEWRWKIKEFHTGHSCFLTGPDNTVSAREYRPLWDGSDLQGKTILLHAEQGLGDSIQFVRYAAIVKNKGGKVIVGCYPQLNRLFSTVDGIDLLIVKGEPIPEFDVQSPMLSLPHILGTTRSTIPANTAYLTAPADCQFALLPDRKFKVGIVWAGNPKHRKNMQRSCSLSAFIPLLDVSGVSFYSLQKELSEADRALLHQTSIVDLSPHFGDFADTAAAIAQLDLVITVDTAVAHLAGALGKPVWILLAFSPDWRWLLEREDTPWYPTARLFRQSIRGDWEGVFERVAQALGSAVSQECAQADEADAALIRGRDLQQQGELRGAIECYERAIAIAPNYAIAYSNLGVVKQQIGLLPEAIAYYRQALAIEPNLAETLSNLGSALADAGETAEAIAVYDRALSLNPNCAEAWINLGLARENQGDLAEAINCYLKGIQLNPNSAEAYLNLGIALEKQGDKEGEAREFYEQAIANYERAIAIHPNYLEALQNLAYAAIRQGKIADAIAYYERATALQPDLAATLIGLGSSLQQQGKLDEALAVCQQAIQKLPANAEAHCNLGIVFHKQGKIANAIACYQQALSRKPDFPAALNNLGKAFEEEGKMADAMDCYHRAIELQPNNINSCNGLGNALQQRGEFADAVACYSQGVEFNRTHPEAHLNLALALLLVGDFERGFSEYEWRLLVQEKQFPTNNFMQPLWDGKDLDGKTILLCPEQGLGDAIQFIRYADLVKQKGGQVIVWCQPHLQRLFEQVSGIDRLIVSPESAPDFDVRAQLMSLPHLLGTTLATIPAQVPYLAPPPGLEFTLHATSNLKVGIVWSGNPNNSQNNLRSFPLNSLLKLLDIPGVEFYSLQKEISEEEATLLEQMSIADLSPYLHDFAHTAAAISALDLVISMDTSVAHLAGALGKTVWILLCFTPDWRWMLEGEESPWYPTARLFRQEKSGDWEGVFERLALALKAKICEHQPEEMIVGNQPNLELAQKQFNRGNILKSQGKFSEAIAYFKNALVYQPDLLEAATNLAVTLHQIGDFTEAATYYLRSIQIDPNSAPAHNNLGILRQAQGNIAEAVSCFQKAIALNPLYVKALNNLGAILQQQGELPSAIAYFQQALSATSNCVPALINLGVAMEAKCQPEEAKRFYQQCIELEPDNPKGYYYLGTLCLKIHELEQAISHLETALVLHPDSVEDLNNLGSALEGIGDIPRAISCYNQALTIDAKCGKVHFNLALALLLSGDLPRGFAEYEWRWETDQAKKLQWFHLAQPVWDGSDLNGKTILLRCEQGLGDAIQFVRYAPIVQQKGGKVVVSCYQELKRLFKAIPGIEQVAVRVEELPEFHLQAPLMSLPYILGTNLENIPANIPYLSPPAGWNFSLDSNHNLKIGIVWAGSSEHLKDFMRSTDLSYFLKLLDIPGVSFYSLQKEISAGERTLLNQIPVTDLSDNLNDFADTAAVISQLDLVICVDTAVAHLVGALGKPVWILLSFVPDWRWMLEREDSPWYPTARLFRQQKPGDWEGVFDRLKTALQEMARTHLPQDRAGLGAQDRAGTGAQDRAGLGAQDRAGLGAQDRAGTGAQERAPTHLPQDRAGTGAQDRAGTGAQDRAGLGAQDRAGLGAQDRAGLGAQDRAGLGAQDRAGLGAQDRAGLGAQDRAGLGAQDRAGLGAQDRAGTGAQDRAGTGAPPLQSNLLSPAQVEFHIANALKKQGKKEAAIARYEQVITIHPQHAEAHSYLGYLKQQNGLISEAISHYQQALEINPNQGETNLYLGCALEEQGKVAEAIDYYDRAIQQSSDSPNTHFRLALALLLTGNFPRGFAEYEWRWKTQELEPRYFAQPLWDGADLQGKTILLHPEQGLGDTIHFIRYAALVKQKGGKVIVACHQSLKRLFEGVAGIDHVVSRPKDLPDFQVQSPLMSLPRILGTTWENLPVNIPYLAPPQNAKFLIQSSNQLKVGIVWAGGPLHRKNNDRSCKLTNFMQFLDIPGASFYSLQKDLSPGDRSLLNQQQISDLSQELGDFADTAAIISQLDLVICVDTAVAHLAGALGKPVWILLSFVPDWRWMLEREDSPWYPTVRLFRQQKAGDWEGVCDRIKTALQDTVSTGIQERAGTGAQERAGTGAQERAGTGIQDTVSTGIQDTVSTGIQDRAGTGAPPLQSTYYQDQPQIQPPETPPKITGIGITWPVSVTSGWGIYGINLTLQLLRNPAWEVALLAPPSISEINQSAAQSAVITLSRKTETVSGISQPPIQTNR